jgi:hypothetical protein
MKSVLHAIVAMVVGLCGSHSNATGNASSSIKVAVDPRIELLTIVQLLADWEMKGTFITELDYPYKQEVLAHFSQYAGQSATVMYPDMLAYGFAYDAPVQAILNYSNPPELKKLAPIPQDVLRRSGGEENLEKLIAALRDFATVTEFMTFFDAHQAYYDSITAAVQKVTAGEDYVSQLEDYCGVQQHSYTIILALLQSARHSYGPRVPAPDGSQDVYFIGGPGRIQGGLPYFGDKDNLEDITWHEFGHSFVNPLVDSNATQIMQYSALLKPIYSTMKQQAYGDWKTCATEHILRAVNARMTYRKNGQEAGDRVIQYNRSNAFAYIEALCKKLEEYEKQRDKYPTLKRFFPELIGVFKQLSESNLDPDFYKTPFFGTISAVVTDKKAVVLIVPSNESDKAVQDSLCRQVQGIHDRFYKESPLLVDTVALTTDLSTNSIVVYGTAKGNLWLAQLMPRLPVSIEPDRIVADGVYLGANLRLIMVWPNPQNQSKGVVIYTAQQAKDIIGINGVFHGPTDYVIARNSDVLKADYYLKKGAAWTF